MKEIFSALIKAQSEMKIATKDSVNPHFRNRYADFGSVYDACKDALHRNGLAVLQPTRIHESGITVVVISVVSYRTPVTMLIVSLIGISTIP